MEAQKYGLIEDLDTFIETGGTEGLADGGVDTPEPAQAEPAQAEPAQAEPAQAEPAQAEPAQAEPAQSEPAQSEPAQVNVLETQEYKDLLSKVQDLEKSLEGKVELRPELKEIQEWSEKTNRPIEDWIKFSKDFSELSGIDIVRETQRMTTDFTDEEIEFYIKDKFVPDEYADDDEKMRKSIALKEAVNEGKKFLESNRLKFNSPSDATLTIEQKQDLALAAEYKKNEEIQKQSVENYNKQLSGFITSTDSLSVSFGDGKTLEFKVPTEGKSNHAQYMAEIPSWKNTDGSLNYQNMVNDSYKIKHFNEILNLVYEQGKNDQQEQAAADSRNIATGPNVQYATEAGSSKYGLVQDGRAKRRYQV